VKFGFPEWLGCWMGMAFLVLAVINGCVTPAGLRERCKAAGGDYFKMLGQSDLCIRPEMIIK
jgi:hypothetical protein